MKLPRHIEFKEERFIEQFHSRPILLQRLATLFIEESVRRGITPTITRITDRLVSGNESGVHAAGRAIDFRDFHKGVWLYPKDVRRTIVSEFNKHFQRRDGRVTLLHHGGTSYHFHLQIPYDESTFIEDPEDSLRLLEARFLFLEKLRNERERKNEMKKEIIGSVAVLLVGTSVAQAADLVAIGDMIGSYAEYATHPMALLGIGLLEGALRLVKTEKPKSIIRGIAAILRGSAKIVEALAGILDKIVPDRTSEEG
jgi:hypothetical protein